MKRLLPFLVLAACGPTKSAEPTQPTTAETRAAPDNDPVAAARAKVEAVAGADFQDAKQSSSSQPGPAETIIVRAMVDGQRPGVGVAAAFVTKGGVIIGPKDKAGFADFVRQRGWLAQPPPGDILATLANIALFDGLLAFDETPPKVSGAPDAVVLELIVVAYPSGAKDRVTVRVGSAGPTDVQVTAADPQPAEPSSPAAALAAAQQKDDPVGMGLAIGKLQRTTDPAAITALAHATTYANETVATNALMALGPTPEAAKALKQAWTGLSADARARLVATATELFPSEFVNQLK